ncbi:MAG: hypothetical protein H7Y86_22090 [Rhizobacter sp.]|nr:hypothetical protein [Ferruginibacter sp.]
MKTIQLLIVVTVCMLTYNSNAQNKTTQSMQQQIASSIFKGWQTGEAGGGYYSFRKYVVADGFQYFSHPLLGNYTGKEAYEKLMSLVKEREIKPNMLQFSNITRYQHDNSFCFQFDSEGKVGDGFDYKGYNIIQLEIQDGKLISFREYFGYINPSWFK